MDDFGIKYVGREHAQHLPDTLQQFYKISTDWEGSLYCRITLQWDYNARTVDLSMPGYIPKVLEKLQHPQPAQPEHAPHKSKPISYELKVQLVEPEDASPKLGKTEMTRIQQIVSALLFYARAVDPTMPVTIGILASQQASATEATAKATVQLLNYAVTHPDAVLCYKATDMILHIHSNGSYLKGGVRLVGISLWDRKKEAHQSTMGPSSHWPPYKNGNIISD